MKTFSLIILCLISIICTAKKTTYAVLDLHNYIKTDMNVLIACYDKDGSLKTNQSFIVPKATGKDDIVAGKKSFTVKVFKEGNIRIKYQPVQSNSRYTIDPIEIPNSNDTLKQMISLTGLTLYDVNDNKNRLIALGTQLKFDSNSTFTRLIDVKDQLGSLILGKQDSGKLIVVENIPLKNIDITYSQPNKLTESTVTERSTLSQLKLAIPIYGSIEASMSNADLHNLKWDITYYPFLSNVSMSNLITDLDQASKKKLISKLKLNDTGLHIYILRNFDVIESGIFSVTTGTKITTEGNAAIASVFTASAAYAFKSENSQFVSIPNKAYNLKYEKWQSVGSLLKKLEQKTEIIPDNIQEANLILEPLMLHGEDSVF